MGIEPTQDASQRPANGFEDRGRHQPPYIPSANRRRGQSGTFFPASAGTRGSCARAKHVNAGTRGESDGGGGGRPALNRWGDQRFELGLQVALHVRAVADGSLRGLAVLEDDHRRDRHDPQ